MRGTRQEQDSAQDQRGTERDGAEAQAALPAARTDVRGGSDGYGLVSPWVSSQL